MPAYNSAGFDPPAPVALVSFVNPDTGQRVDDVPMLVDTGADATVVPHAVFQVVSAAPELATAYEVEFLEDGTATLSSIRLQMKWLGLNFTGDFLVARTHHGVIGRNILNRLHLVLDGPNLQWEAR